jgi:hypothetical protein
MNERWRKESISLQKEVKLTDVVHGTLSKNKQERMQWHFDHPTPYYFNRTKENPYGNEQSSQR